MADLNTSELEGPSADEEDMDSDRLNTSDLQGPDDYSDEERVRTSGQCGPSSSFGGVDNVAHPHMSIEDELDCHPIPQSDTDSVEELEEPSKVKASCSEKGESVRFCPFVQSYSILPDS